MAKIIKQILLTIVVVSFACLNVHSQCTISTNLFAYYPFTGNLQDSSGNGRTLLEVTGSSASYGTGHNGKTNSAVTVGTATDNLEVGGSGSAYTGPTVFSVMLWFKTQTPYSGYGGTIVSFGTLAGSGGTVDRSIYLESTGKVVFSNNATTNGSATQAQKLADRISSTATYNDGNWHQVAVTCSTGTAILYLDGVQVASGTLTVGQTATAGWWRFLRQMSPEEYAGSIAGCTDPCANGRQLYNGYIDDAYIYSGRILTATEIANEYSLISSNSPVTCAQTLNLTAGTITNATYSWTGPNSFSSSLQSPSITNATNVNNGTYTLVVSYPACSTLGYPKTFTLKALTTGNVYPPAPTSNLQTYYSFDNLTTTDLSGKSNPAIYQGTVPTVADQYGSSNLAIGPVTTSNYFTSTKALINPSVFSIGIWFQTATAAGGNLVRFGANLTGTGGNNDRSIDMTAGGNLTFSVYTGSTVTITSPLTYNDNNWHQAVATLGSGGMALYVDGTLVASNANTTAQNTTGYWRNGYSNFNGYLDEFSYYSAVLTSTQISALYIAPISNNVPVCNGTLNLTAPTVAGATYAWTGPNSFTSTTQNPSISGASSTNNGTYSVTITKGSCSSTGSSASVSINPLPVPASTTNLNTYYSFDNAGTTDLSGKSNTAVFQGSLPFVADQFGSANSAIGPVTTSNYFSSTKTYVNPNTFSIGIWFQSNTSLGGNLVRFAQYTGGSANDRSIDMNTNGTISFWVYNGSQITITSPNAYNDNNWHQAVATLGSGGMALYVDGTLVASNTSNTVAQNYTGYWRNGYSNFNGYLDEFSYYGAVLSSSQIASLYISPITYNTPLCDEVLYLTAPTVAGATYSWTGPNSFTSTTQNPSVSAVNSANSGVYTVTITRGVCSSSASTPSITINPLPVPATTSGLYTYYSFDNGTTTDLSGRSNTAVFVGNVPSVTDQFGNANSAIGPITTSNYLASTVTYVNPSTFTIGIWFQTTTGAGGNLIRLAQTTGGSANDRSIDMNNDGTVSFWVYNGSQITISSTTAYNDNLWHQAVATLGSGGMALYVDGVLVASNTSNTVAQNFNGYWRNGYANFNGYVDEFSYYNVVLTTSQIASLYISPLSKNFPLCGGTLNLTSPSIPGATYSWTGPSSFTSSVQNPSISNVTPAVSGTYNLTISKGTCSASGSITVSVTPLPAPATTTGLLTYYAFSNGAVTADLSGTGNTMVNVGSVGQVSDQYGNANSAIGPFTTSSYISSTNQYNNPNTFTIGIWFQTNTSLGGNLIRFAQYTGGSANDRSIDMNANGTISFWVYNGGQITITSTSAYNDNLWHQAVATLGSGGMALYVDGTLVASNTGNTIAQNYTGYWRNGYNSFNGYLDEFSFYNVVLSNAQISGLYITPLTGNNPTCGTTFNLTAPTIPGATYSWTGPNSFTSSSQNPSIPSISSVYNGTYNLTISTGVCTSSGSTSLTVSSFPAMASTTGLLTFYGFNNGSNTLDMSGSGNTMVPQGTLTYVADQFGNTGSALGPTTTSNYISSTSTYVNPQTFTIGIWFKTATSTASNLIRFAQFTGGSANDRSIDMNANGNVQFWVYNGSQITVTSSSAYNDNNWHQAVATLSSSGMQLYVDGVLVGSNANTTAQNYTGYWRNGYNSFNGSLDNFCYYNQVLSSSVIAALFIEPPTQNNPSCGGTLSLTAPVISGATYAWTGPNSFTSSSDPATLSNVATPTNNGTYSVTVTSGTCSRTGSVSVTVGTSGNPTLSLSSTATTICAGTSVTFTANTLNAGGGVATYVFLNGATVLQSGSSNTYTTTALTNGMAVSCSLNLANPTTCMTGSPSAVNVTSNSITMTVNAIPATPTLSTTISGGLPLTLCQGSTTFNITASGGSTYVWTLPSTASLITGGSTATISKSAALSTNDAGTYSVVATSNGCSSASASTILTVSPLPSTPGSITGTSSVCQGQSGVVYAVAAITNATGYTWTLPTGGTITAGTGTNSITVSFSGAATTGNVAVTGTNACGSGATSSSYSVTVNPSAPGAAGTIVGTSAVCQGQTGINYTVPAITNATSYTWTVPTGATITSGSTSRSIFVTYTGSAVSGNFTVKGTNGCGNGTVSANYAVTVSSSIPGAAGTITGTSSVCQGTSGVVYSVAAISGATGGYTWTLPTGASITSGANTNSITVSFSSSASGGNITVYGINPCGNGASSSFAVAVSSTQTWTGTTSNDWNTASNWCGQIPFISTNVVIPSGTTFSPSVNSAGAVANNLTINSGATLTLSGSNSLTINGNWSNSGTFVPNTGTVVFGSTTVSATTTQTVSGSSVTSFNNITINNTTSGGVSLGSAQSIQGILTMAANTNFVTNGNAFTLLSTSTDSTASIAALPSTATITGNITVQRYIPAKRVFRYLASPVSNATFTQWQANTEITGPGGASNGFDVSYTDNPSCFYYDETVQGRSFRGYTTIPNTSGTITPGLGYRILIRGDRTINLYANAPAATPTTLSVKGSINRGTFNYPVTYTTTVASQPPAGGIPFNAASNDGWNLVGNPYPATIDWAASSGWTKTNLDNAIYLWDPQISQSSTSGGYVQWVNGITTPSTLANPTLIAPSQGFYVKANAASPALSSTESVKSSSQIKGYFRLENAAASAPKQLIRLRLVKDSAYDETVVYFQKGATFAFDGQYDAYKLASGQIVNVSSLITGGIGISINGLPPIDSSFTVPLSVVSSATGNHTLAFTEFDSTLTDASISLTDNYLNTSNVVSKGYQYGFSITSDTLSQGNARFELTVQSAKVVTGYGLGNSKTDQLSLYPNPSVAGSGVTIRLYGWSAGNVTVSVKDISGKGIFTTNSQIISNQSVIQLPEVAELPAGIYMVSVQSATGRYLTKLVVGK